MNTDETAVDETVVDETVAESTPERSGVDSTQYAIGAILVGIGCTLIGQVYLDIGVEKLVALARRN